MLKIYIVSMGMNISAQGRLPLLQCTLFPFASPYRESFSIENLPRETPEEYDP